MRHGDPMPHEADLDDEIRAKFDTYAAKFQAACSEITARIQQDRDMIEQQFNDAMARHPAGKGQVEPDWAKDAVEAQPQIDAQMEAAKVQRDEIRDAKHWAELVRARARNVALEARLKDQSAKIGRIDLLIDLWQASPDMRTRAHADRLSEAFDGRPRA